MDDFVDNGRLCDKHVGDRVFSVRGSLKVAVKGEVVVDPDFEFALGVEAGIEFGDRNCSKFSVNFLVGQNALF